LRCAESVARMNQHVPNHADLRRFRQEAAAVLGIAEPK
jgi:hypothetical protein